MSSRSERPRKAVLISEHSSSATGGIVEWAIRVERFCREQNIELTILEVNSSAIRQRLPPGSKVATHDLMARHREKIPRPARVVWFLLEAIYLSFIVLRDHQKSIVLVSSASKGRFLVPFGPLSRATYFHHSGIYSPTPWLHRSWNRLIAGRQIQFVSPSHFVDQGLRSFIGSSMAESRFRVIPHYAEVEASRDYSPSSRDIILTVGELIHEKSPHFWLDVVRAFGEICPYSELRFCWLGSGELYERVRRAVNEDPILTRFVVLPGYSSDVYPFYDRALIYLQVSKREAAGIAATDALVRGIPLVLSSGNGLQELVVPGMNGFLVENRKPNEVAQKISEMANSPRELQRLSLGSPSNLLRAHSKESWEAAMMTLLSI